MPLLRRVSVLAAKIETTSGTIESLTASEAAFNVFNAVMQPTIPSIERKSQGSFSHLPATSGPRMAKLTFQTELFGDGSGTTPGWASTFLPGCGFTESTTVFTPKSEAPGTNVKTLTFGLYQNGLLKRMRGCSGNFKLNFKPGFPITIDWEFTGVWQAPTDTAIVAPTYPTLMPIRCAAGTLTLNSASIQPFETLEISSGNVIVPRYSVSASDGSGYHNFIITDRKVVGKIDPESDLVATLDNHGLWIASTEHALSLTVANATDSIVFAAPKVQRINVQQSEREGINVDDIDFQCNKSAAAGNDEFSITFNPA